MQHRWRAISFWRFTKYGLVVTAVPVSIAWACFA